MPSLPSLPRRPELVVNAAELLREPGARRHVTQTLDPAALDAAHPAIIGDVTVDLALESSIDDVVVSGTLAIPWAGVCRRCLKPLVEVLSVDVAERYAEHPDLVVAEGAMPIERGQIDLRDLVRDEVLLAADEERLCRADCAGLCPTCGRDRNEGTCDCAPVAGDERWGVLDQLRQHAGDGGGASSPRVVDRGDRPLACNSPVSRPETNDGRSQEEEVEVEEP